MNKHKLVYKHHWDDKTAHSTIWWELYEYSKNWLGSLCWRPVKTWYYDSDGYPYKDIVIGDREWAEKIAKHYGIKVPDKSDTSQ